MSADDTRAAPAAEGAGWPGERHKLAAELWHARLRLGLVEDFLSLDDEKDDWLGVADFVLARLVAERLAGRAEAIEAAREQGVLSQADDVDLPAPTGADALAGRERAAEERGAAREKGRIAGEASATAARFDTWADDPRNAADAACMRNTARAFRSFVEVIRTTAPTAAEGG